MGQSQPAKLQVFQKPSLGVDPNPPLVDLLNMPFHPVKEKPAGCKVRVLSFNILAQSYLDIYRGGFSQESVFAAEPAYRAKSINQMFHNLKPDIICLQEVDKQMRQFIEPTLQKKYSVLAFKRPHGKPDGLIVAFDKARFKEVSSGYIDFNKSARESDFKDDQRFQTCNICAWVRLLDTKSQEELVVYNAHTYWNPKMDDVKYFQLSIVIKKLMKKQEEQPNFIFCGDFNSTPRSNPISLLKGEPPLPERIEFDGELGDKIIENCKKIFEKIDQSKLAVLSLENAYSRYEEVTSPVPINESTQFKIVAKTDGYPSFTNFSQDFRSTLDHIFHSSQFKLGALLGLPTGSQLGGAVTLPSKYFPSDHLPIAADLYLQIYN
jgi:mRNA deadenylase 3'-5' endonuclease subunit Ccr4